MKDILDYQEPAPQRTIWQALSWPGRIIFVAVLLVILTPLVFGAMIGLLWVAIQAGLI
jgi:tetrahydromethanopterin S-methyltransferase subunit B